MSKKNRTHGVVSTPGNALEIISADRDEWKRRALAYERQRDQALEDLRINLDVIYDQRSELFELRAFRAEVLDVCTRATLVVCVDCNGGPVQRLHSDKGAPRGIRVETVTCMTCGGSGMSLPSAKPARCSACSGIGRAQHVRHGFDGSYAGIYTLDCTACEGIGWTVP